MLCDVCKRSLEGTNDPTVTPRLRAVYQQVHHTGRALFDIEKYVFGHHRTRQSLEQSIEEPCYICVGLKSALSDTTLNNPSGYFTTFEMDVKDEQLEVISMSYMSGYSNVCHLVPLEAEQGRAAPEFELDPSTYGQYARKLIDIWDKNCLAKHLRCGQVRDSAFLPTRLLELEDVSNSDICRLVLREEVPPYSPYMALSYCWGSVGRSGRICLSQSTFDTMRAGIPLGSLPKTYIDAIHVTARLGVRHIWIDALCIIQDSPHDWRSEASTMQAVYRNSYLTISAVAGTHDNSGLFSLRQPPDMEHTFVNIAYTSGDRPRPFLHASEELARADSWCVGNVTMKRGWCLQERLLPSRVLYFGAQQVFWECHEQCASEMIPGSVLLRPREPSHGAKGQRTRVWKRSIANSLDHYPGKDPYYNLFEEWYKVLHDYSSCQLTRTSDKLVAISGLAKDMRSALNSCRPGIYHIYLAGLWAEDLRYGLCWYTNPGFGRRSAVYRAPSWSPMSVDGSISWDNWPNKDFTYHIDDVNCTAVTHCMGDLDTGEITGGQLELTGPWMTIKTVATETAYQWYHSIQFQSFDPSSALEIPLIADARGMIYSGKVYYDTEDEIVEQALCMPIYSTSWSPHEESFHGILLVPVEVRSSKYRRIGVIEGFCDVQDTAKDFCRTENIANDFFMRYGKGSVTVI